MYRARKDGNDPSNRKNAYTHVTNQANASVRPCIDGLEAPLGPLNRHIEAPWRRGGKGMSALGGMIYVGRTQQNTPLTARSIGTTESIRQTQKSRDHIHRTKGVRNRSVSTNPLRCYIQILRRFYVINYPNTTTQNPTSRTDIGRRPKYLLPHTQTAPSMPCKRCATGCTKCWRPRRHMSRPDAARYLPCFSSYWRANPG